MPQQVLNSTENNFTKGLLTEFTGLNFPENAATATSNCVYTLVGDVIRRDGFDYEANASLQTLSRTNLAISTYKWNNAGGDGLSQIVVKQVGGIIYFYLSSAATISSPLSAQLLGGTVTLMAAQGATLDTTVECTYSDGNGYLFVYHKNCDPVYVTFNPITLAITSNPIIVQIRDFVGVIDGLQPNVRPTVLTNDHSYNLQNQGWTASNPWLGIDNTTVNPNPFSVPTTGGYTIATGLTIVLGTAVTINYYFNSTSFGVATAAGTVTAYNSGTGAITLNITSYTNQRPSAPFSNITYIIPTNVGYITTWHTAEGNYPSNADVWWYFKDSTGVFNPATTQPNVSLATGNAPQGHYILNAFIQDRAGISGLSTVTPVTTIQRPSNGCWFQGRVWYTGLNASQALTGDANFYTWTENIYFSQIVQTPSDFGACYQQNDPTSQNLFNLLPTDGGVIQIQGSGPIYKLFPLMNALLVFAANGVWYISGSTGIGFAADDYSVVKLSAVRSISTTSYVDINGLPMFWNEEGIYRVEPAKQGQSLLNTPLHVNPLEVNPITVGTIQTFFDNIPLQSKKFARGVYDPINYIVQMVYKTTNETSVTDRYTYDAILIYNTHNQAFYPYNFDIVTNTPPTINGIIYVQSPGGTNTPTSQIKYVVSNSTAFTFAEENDFVNFVDWHTSGVSNNYVSSFTTGFKLHGQASRRFQIPYIYVYSRLGQPVSYYLNSSWDYPLNTNSGRISNKQFVTINSPNFGMAFRRHRLRGWGIALQLNFSSVDGKPFDIMGWSLYETANQGP